MPSTRLTSIRRVKRRRLGKGELAYLSAPHKADIHEYRRRHCARCGG